MNPQFFAKSEISTGKKTMILITDKVALNAILKNCEVIWVWKLSDSDYTTLLIPPVAQCVLGELLEQFSHLPGRFLKQILQVE